MCFCSSLTEDKARIAFIDLKAGLPILRVAWKALAEIIASASRTKVNFIDGDVLVVGRGGVSKKRLLKCQGIYEASEASQKERKIKLKKNVQYQDHTKVMTLIYVQREDHTIISVAVEEGGKSTPSII